MSNKRHIPNEKIRGTVESLDPLVRAVFARGELSKLLTECDAEVSVSADAIAVRPLNLDIFGDSIPNDVGMCRLVVFGKNACGSSERHPNSTQYIIALKGHGTVRVLRGKNWLTDKYGEDWGSELETRWHVVESGVWHQPFASGHENWVVLAFHSAKIPVDEYMDERDVTILPSGAGPAGN